MDVCAIGVSSVHEIAVRDLVIECIGEAIALKWLCALILPRCGGCSGRLSDMVACEDVRCSPICVRLER
jgi:hypothetical protein